MSSKPKLNLFDLSMIVIGLVIGMGIFRTSRDAAQAALTPAIFFSAWIVGGFVALCGALTYAEIGSRYPVTGGYYRIFSYAYHPSIAFAINWVSNVPDAPTRVPATMSSVIRSTAPLAATARPVNAFSSEMTTGTSAPPTCPWSSHC